MVVRLILLYVFLGLYTAAHDLGIEWVVIKGISDYADEKKSETDSWRLFASLMASSLTAEILSDYNVFQHWPHYGGEYANHSANSLNVFLFIFISLIIYNQSFPHKHLLLLCISSVFPSIVSQMKYFFSIL